MTTSAESPTAIESLVAPRRRSGGNIALVLAIVVACAGLAFAAGRVTAPASAGQTGFAGAPGQGPNASFAPGADGAPGGGSMSLEGTVAAISGTTLTITTSDGRTMSVDLSGATYHAQSAASAADVATGATVRLQVSGMAGSGGQGGSAVASGAPSTITASDVTVLAP